MKHSHATRKTQLVSLKVFLVQMTANAEFPHQ